MIHEFRQLENLCLNMALAQSTDPRDRSGYALAYACLQLAAAVADLNAQLANVRLSRGTAPGAAEDPDS